MPQVKHAALQTSKGTKLLINRREARKRNVWWKGCLMGVNMVSAIKADSHTISLGDWTFVAPKNTVDPHPSLRATLSHKERENNKWGLWTQTDVSSHAVVSVGMKRLFVTLKSALQSVDHSLALWGEGGRRPGEGRPTGIASQNVQSPESPLGK